MSFVVFRFRKDLFKFIMTSVSNEMTRTPLTLKLGIRFRLILEFTRRILKCLSV